YQMKDIIFIFLWVVLLTSIHKLRTHAMGNNYILNIKNLIIFISNFLIEIMDTIFNVNELSAEGHTLLYEALVCGHSDIADCLIQRGVNDAILEIAVTRNNVPIAQLLLRHEAK